MPIDGMMGQPRRTIAADLRSRPADAPWVRPGAIADPSICPACDSRLVQPLDWNLANRRSWRIELRCPECEWRGSDVFGEAEIDRFDERLESGSRILAAALSELTRANMREQLERLRLALDRDLLLPEDF